MICKKSRTAVMHDHSELFDKIASIVDAGGEFHRISENDRKQLHGLSQSPQRRHNLASARNSKLPARHS